MKSTKNIQSTMGGRLRRYIAFRGQSLREYAEEAGIPYSTLQNYVGDTRRPAAQHLAKMAETGLDVNWLLTGRLREGDLLKNIAPSQEIIGADLEIVEHLKRKAFDVVDAAHREAIKRGEKPRTTEALLDLAVRLLSMMLRVAEEMADTIVDLRSRGVPLPVLLEVITTAVEARGIDLLSQETRLTAAQVKAAFGARRSGP